MKLLNLTGICRAVLFAILCVLSASTYGYAQVDPRFTTPDTVCVKTPVTITNTSTNASSYYWKIRVVPAL